MKRRAFLKTFGSLFAALAVTPKLAATAAEPEMTFTLPEPFEPFVEHGHYYYEGGSMPVMVKNYLHGLVRAAVTK